MACEGEKAAYQAAMEAEHQACEHASEGLGFLLCLAAVKRTADAADALHECMKKSGQVGIADQVSAHQADVAYMESLGSANG